MKNIIIKFLSKLINYIFRKKNINTILYVLVFVVIRELAAIGVSEEINEFFQKEKSENSENYKFYIYLILEYLLAKGSYFALSIQIGLILFFGYLKRTEKTNFDSILNNSIEKLIKEKSNQRDKIDKYKYDLLEYVKSYWIDGYLNSSLENTIFIDLKKKNINPIIRTPWDFVLGTDQKEEFKEKGVKEIYSICQGYLFIAGIAGAGKTTTMLQLCKEIINDNSENRIPVYFSLSTWNKSNDNVFNWVVTELYLKYHIPVDAGKVLLENEEIILLLDALDEAPGNSRLDCLNNINQFRKEYPNIKIVLSCRIEDYIQLDEKLNLNGGIKLQPLSLSQVYEYLDQGGPNLKLAKRIIKKNIGLQEIAKNPLNLRIISIAYYDLLEDKDGRLYIRGARGDLDFANKINVTTDNWKDHLFETYAQKMVSRKPVKDNLTKDNIYHYLSLFAKKLVENQITLFSVEDIQPSWLNSINLKIYNFFIYLVLGFAVGVPLSIALAIKNVPIIAIILISVVICCIVGFCVDFCSQKTKGILFGWLNDRDIIRRISTVQIISLPKSKAFDGFIIGGLALILIGVFIKYSFLHYLTLMNILLGGFIGGALGVVISFLVNTKKQNYKLLLSPNQGLYLALKNAILIGLMVCLFIGFASFSLMNIFPNRILIGIAIGFVAFLLTSITYGLISSIPVGGAILFSYVIFAQNLSSIKFGIISGFSCGIAFLLFFGGLSVIQHFTVRILFHIETSFPLKVGTFFQRMTDLIFFRRTGGHFIFVHRELRDFYFRKFDKENFTKQKVNEPV